MHMIKHVPTLYLLYVLLVTQISSWCLKRQITQSNKVRSLDYSPDGSMLALGMEDNSVKIYDAYTYDIKFSFNAPDKPYALKFNHLSSILAVGSLNDGLRIVTISTFAVASVASGQGEVYSIDFNSDSTIMATCGKDNNQLKMWNTATWTAITPLFGSQGGTDFKSCEFTSTNNIIVGDSAGAVRVFSSPYALANIVGSAVSYGAPITSVSNRYTTADYIASENNNKKGWASFDNANPVYITAPAKTIETTSYARTLDYFMYGGAERKVVIYNATNKNNSLAQSFSVSGNILSSDFTNNGQYLAVGAEDNKVSIYSLSCTIQCDVAYFYNASTKLCDLCSSTIEGCGQCYTNTTCGICYQGYFLTAAKICQTCTSAAANMMGCALCTNSSYCTSPLPGYYLSSNLPLTCQAIMPGCLMCSSSTTCLQCHNEYYLNSSNKCQPCSSVTNCLKCYNASYCTQCEMGYYPNTAVANTATCSRCGTNCLDCQSPTVCFECVIGYYTTGGLCLQCSANCLSCNNTNYCTDCASNTFMSAGNCVACTIPCLTCVTAATTCLSCYSGYYFDGTSACVLCPTGCTSCTGASVCMTCAQGFYYVSANTSCVRCTTTYPNCQSCNSTNCTICLTSFFYDSTANLCKSCATQMHGCVLCSSPTACLFCAPGHYLSALTGSQSCQPCALGCGTCETGTNCTSCVPGYYFDSATYTCLKCSSKCETCTSPTFCISCVIGYYMQNVAAGTCLACNATKAYCLACVHDSSNTLQCTECGVGFFLNSGSCSRCMAPCVTCSTSATTCLSCELGFYLNGTAGTCLTCSPFCAECSVNGTCESCQIGYYFSSPNCLSCSALGCLTCKNNLKCLTCPAGSYLITATELCETCSTPLPNCFQCSSPTVCSQCAYGYALTTTGATTNCTTCSTMTGCYHCSSLSVCLACQSGYWLNGNTCSPCLEGCRSCVNGTYCFTCGTSYFSGNVLGGANVGTCLRCEFYLDGCQLCQNNTDCSNCQSGYYLTTVGTNTVCKICELNIPYCSLCNTSTVCSSCKGGYYLAANSLSCIQCSNTFTSCRLCDRLGTTCTDCQSGYYLSGSGTCLLCSGNLPGCQLCNGSATCVQCLSGYFLNSPNCQLCSTTMPGCIFCSASNICQQCEGGYYLHTNNTCVPCNVLGCEVCVQASPSSCVTCNSLYYKSSATACTLCRSSMTGCLTCTSATACAKCDVGYYENPTASATPQCLLCSDAMEGCSICTTNSLCLQCKSMYFLNSSSQCQTCSIPLTGCTFCTNSTVCLSCGSGFFKNASSLCQSCTDLPGCLVCKDSATCLFCDTGYYFNAYSCLSCTVMTGCYSCISSTVCTSCIGGYSLNSNSQCDVAQVKGTSKVTDLLLKTFYVDADTLKHFLYVKGMAFTKAALNWQTNASLYLYTTNGTKVNLRIKDVQWATDNNYTLIFFTDNPINMTSKTKKMPFARRLLGQSIDLSDTKTGIQLSDQAIQQLLPGYTHSGSLVLDYKLDNPQFYASYTKQYISPFPYYAIGATFVCLFFLKYALKSLATVPKSPNLGNIIPHILAFKVGALLLFPTYFEYISYCSGFMYADLPWLNRFFGERLADSRDITPAAYSLFYDNRNLASMYLLALSIFILLVIITLIVGKSLPKYEYKMNAFLTFLYNFFAFGMFFAGCASLQGAIVNPIQSLSVNAAFYIMGILMYFALLCECIYKVSQNKALYFWKVRIVMKATLLSLSHYSPIYLLASTVVIDIVLVTVEYQLNPYGKAHPKSWIFANVTCNLALILLVFLPIIELTMVLVSACLFFVLVAEAIMHYHETRENLVVSKLDVTENQRDNEIGNMWDLNFTDKEIKKTMESSQNFYGKTKATFKETNNQNMQTMYVAKDGQNKDLEETQVFGAKYKRQRNFKKVREQAKGKRMQIEDIQNKSNPNNDSRQKNQQQNLTFVMEDL